MKNNTNYPVALVVCLAAITLPGAAFAQDSDDLFTGPSLGIQGGYERQKIDEPILDGANTVTLDAREKGVIYGGYAGYDLQTSGFVIGAEAGFSPNGRTITGDTANGGTAEINPKWSAYVSARAGVVLADRALVYGRAGYARTRYTARSFATDSTTQIASKSQNADGLMFGGGIEVAVHENAALRVEYRRNNLDGTFGSNQVLAGATLRF